MNTKTTMVVAIILMIVTAFSFGGTPGRDKSGTNAVASESKFLQTSVGSTLTAGQIIGTERGRFELP